MIKKFTDIDFVKSKRADKLPLQCNWCSLVFYKTKKDIRDAQNKEKENYLLYCSRKCLNLFKGLTFESSCEVCKKYIYRPISQSKSKSGKDVSYERYFCSKSCAAIYNNKNKKHGTRRSKLEVWIESRLSEIYPDLKIEFNQKEAINSELDIYIPSIKLAFELNGIFHYEPIYGDSKLYQIQRNDRNKFQACIVNNISLCIIDCSKLGYFKEKAAKKYLDIIQSIIKQRLQDSNL